jgi:16S rRNA (guanine527-N7)-methyltransferase
VNAADRLHQLARRHDLAGDAPPRLLSLLELLAGDPHTPSAVTDLDSAVDIHVADSLSALTLEPVRRARQIADIGSGAGFPGLVLAIALPGAHVALVESTRRRCEFLERARAATATGNATVVCARAESWAEGISRHDLVTARALAPLAVLLEYAAPLLRVGGTLVAWKGAASEAELAAAGAAGAILGIEPARAIRVKPYAGSAEHHLHMYVKAFDTPNRFPRRPGVARKRPLGHEL